MKRAAIAAVALTALWAAGCGGGKSEKSPSSEIAGAAKADSGTDAPGPIGLDTAAGRRPANGKVGVAGEGSCPTAPADPLHDLQAVRAVTLCLIEAERSARQLFPLTTDTKLAGPAIDHSRDMAKRNYFAHDTLGGGTFQERIVGAGYLRGAKAYSLGENIARGSGAEATPAQIVSSWMNSPEHRANILSRDFTEIGIGVALGALEAGGDPTALIYTADFGTRSTSVRAVPRGPKRGTRPQGPLPFAGAHADVSRLSTEIIHGFVFIRVRCPTGTFASSRRPNDFGFCFGTLNITDKAGKVLAKAPFGIRSGDSWSVDVPAPKSLQRLANRAGRLNLNIVVRSRDGQGNSKTTTSSLLLAKSK